MRILRLWAVTAWCSWTLAQTESGSITLSGTASQTRSALGDVPTFTNLTYNTNLIPSTIATTFTYTRDGTTGTVTGTLTSLSPNTGNSSTTQAPTGTVLSGSVNPTTLTGTASVNGTTTASTAQPTNTTPCNGYTELCERKYSNITHVAAHNSPFVRAGNVAANQQLDVTTQLNDGIRMLQFQVHNLDGTLTLCHTSCDLLNVGSLVDYLTSVREWLDGHRYEVITILMGNYQFLDPEVFVQPVADAGLLPFAYIPRTVPMALDGWPTLGEMILANKRVVFMLDYQANQSEIPWLLDEFSYVWETPFSPTDRDFPCTVDRPPNQDRNVSEQRMSLANHNLNIEIAALGLSILVPAFNLLNETNAETGYGSAGAAVSNCTADWNRPPNFLLVDYYNIGSPINGSVMAVAATANGVTYNSNSCCGTVKVGLGLQVTPNSFLVTLLAAMAVVIML